MKPYRAIPIDGKEFVYGWYIELEDEHYIIPDTASICYGVSIGISHYDFIEGFVKVIPETVGQQVGPKDIKDKEIYQGDIVQRRTTHSQPKLIVEWKEIGWNPFEDDLCDLGNVACYEILGNIHQNPKLLEQGK